MVTYVCGKYWFKMRSVNGSNLAERAAHFIFVATERKKFYPFKIKRNKIIVARSATYLGV